MLREGFILELNPFYYLFIFYLFAWLRHMVRITEVSKRTQRYENDYTQHIARQVLGDIRTQY